MNTTRKSGLGKGLGALIPATASTAETVGGRALRDIPIGSIRPNTYQPREHFDDEALASLTASVRELGVLQPVLVRTLDDNSYELIAGERRWRAARRAGLATIPAIVRDIDNLRSLEEALVENIHREGLHPLEEAAAYQQLVEDFGLTHEDVASRVGKSRVAVTNSLRLLQLPAPIQRWVADGRLTAGHARALLGHPDRARQEALAQQVLAGELSVRATEELVRRSLAEPDPTPLPAASAAITPGRLRAPGLLELEELLAEHLETRVKVDMGAKRGRVVIDFATLDDLERIYRLMVPE